MEVLRVAAYVAEVVAAVAIVGTILAYTLTLKHFNFNVIMSCTTRWHKMMPELVQPKCKRSRVVEELYVDLCNEELFYCTQGYVPDEVIREWLNGMVDYLPHYHDKPDDEVVKRAFGEMVDVDLLDSYPRVKGIFTVDRLYDVNDREARRVLLKGLFSNLKAR